MALPLSDTLISSRRTAYACCAGKYSVLARKAFERGDTKKWGYYKQAMKQALWAASVMNRIPLSTEDADCKCVSDDVACAVIQQMDPLCITCGCYPPPASGGDPTPAPDCTVATDYTLVSVADAFLGPFDVDGTYLITSDVLGIGDPPIGAVGTAASGAFTQTGTLGAGEVALDSDSGLYWQGSASGPWPLFPAAIFTEFASALYVQSSFPLQQQGDTRSIEVEYTRNGSNWTSLGVITGDQLADGYTFSFLATALPVTGVRVTYQVGECFYGPFTQYITTNSLPESCDVCVLVGAIATPGVDDSAFWTQANSSGEYYVYIPVFPGATGLWSTYAGQAVLSNVSGTAIQDSFNPGCGSGDYVLSNQEPGTVDAGAIYRLDTAQALGWDAIVNLHPTLTPNGSNIDWSVPAYVEDRQVSIYYSQDKVNWFLIDQQAAGGGTSASGSIPPASVPAAQLYFVASYLTGSCNLNSREVPYDNS